MVRCGRPRLATGCEGQPAPAVRQDTVRLVFAGTPAPALPSLAALLESPRHEVVAVLTRPDAPTGRGRRMAPSPIAALAQEHGVPVLRPTSPNTPDFVGELAAL